TATTPRGFGSVSLPRARRLVSRRPSRTTASSPHGVSYAPVPASRCALRRRTARRPSRGRRPNARGTAAAPLGAPPRSLRAGRAAGRAPTRQRSGLRSELSCGLTSEDWRTDFSCRAADASVLLQCRDVAVRLVLAADELIRPRPASALGCVVD